MSAKSSSPRRYEKRRRAEAEAQTRRRITDAAVALHATVGPARTTISALARHAGVQRATVYRHFPDEAALFAACGAHWAAANPWPDPAGWACLDDPRERLATALRELYAFYRANAGMLANTRRDAELLPALRAAMETALTYVTAVEELLAAGWDTAPTERRRAAIVLAVDFATWRTLAARLSDAAAAALMTDAVSAAEPGY